MPKRTDIKKIMLIGSGPIVIGQGCEFDYSGVQACKVLRREGYEVVLVNSNPATIMTDPEMADRTYIEPLSVDILHEIIRRERPDYFVEDVDAERLDVSAVGHFRVGHDGGRVGVHEHHFETFTAKHLAGLHAGVVEFAALTNHDRARTDEHNLLDVGTLRHSCLP